MLAFRVGFVACLVLAAAVTAACYPIAPPTRQGVSVPQQITSVVARGAQLQEVPAPAFDFPADVYASQVKKYFQLDDSYFALALQPSMNIPFAPDALSGKFVGILYASAQQTTWSKLFLVNAAVPGNKDNPYWMWTHDNSLYLAVVDQTGAGSGEGIMKLLKLAPEGEWVLDRCYYFGGSYNGPETSGDYLAFAGRVDLQKSLSLGECANWGTLRVAK